MRRGAAPWLLLTVGLAGCAGPMAGGDQTCALSRIAVLPVTFAGHSPVIDARINDAPVRLIFDTGNEQTLLTTRTAQRLGLAPLGLASRVEGVGGSIHADFHKAASLQIGHARATSVQLDVGDVRLRPDIDGLLGRDVLQFYDIDLDLQASRITLYGFAHACDRPAARMAQPMIAVPMIDPILRGSGAPDTTFRVPVTIGGATLNAVVDSGASFSLLDRGAAARAGITAGMLAADRTMTGRGVGPRAEAMPVHRVSSLEVGELEVSDVPMAVGRLQRVWDPEVERVQPTDMLLGIDLMMKIHTWISNSSHSLILQYPPQRSPDPPA